MYSRRNLEKFLQHVETPLSQKRKNFLKFLLHFCNLHKIFHILEEKIAFIA